MRFGTNWRRERRSITSPFLTNFSIALCCVLVLSTWQAGFLYAQTYPSQSVTVGYRDYNYGNTVYPMPTSEKPENKLWWNDGFWWGSLWDPNANSYRIHRFSVANQSWTSVGPNIDNRPQSLADVLWDGQKLYISSHISELTSATGPGRLYRYSYNASTQSYSLDSGFPVDISSKQSETLTLTKDSSGQLWASWVEGSKVMINCSQSSDQSWGTPFQLPVQNSTVGSDDISVIVAFGGHRVGILWSNQNDKKMYFAVHRDADGDNAWQLRETALSDGTKPVADDHMNVKIMTDGSGDIYAVTKSSTSTSSDPLIYLLKRASGGGWASYVVATKSENHTRAIMALDEENRRIYIFMARLSGSPRCIYMKSSDLDNIHFVPGVGDEFIRSESDAFVNDPTSTRQNVNSQTGILILASDETTHNYLHNYLSLGGGNPPPPNQPPVAMASASPTIGVSPLTVNFSSAGSNDPDGTISSYAWDFRDGSSSTQANPSHTYNSAGDYSAILTVTDNKSSSSNATVLISVSPAIVGAVPSITSFSPTSGPVGTQVTIVGNNFSGSTQVVFNSTAAASFSIDSDMQMRATVPAGASTGKISITNNSGIGTSTNNFSVTTSSGGSTITFTPTADTHVNSSSPTRNYGAESSFRIRSGSPAFSAYLKFNVTGLSGAVTRATLRMYVIDDGPYGGAVYSVSNNYKGTSTPWLEEGLNWNNAPALSGTPVAVAGAAKLNAWLEWDVTAALSGDGVFSFGLNSTSTNSVYFSSKEGASAPQLIIETGSGPANQSPVAQASATPVSGVAPLSVNFSSAGSYDPDGSINSYSWNFGDGSSSTQANPAHTYNSAGDYSAILTVTDNKSSSNNATVLISVSPAVVGVAPSITSFSPTSGPLGTQVTIVGNNFSGSTQVVFNSTTAASFSIDSNTQIRATVPAGASTGKISITNNSGTGTSANNFSVTTSSGGSTVTFTPTADTHVNSSNPTRNYGAETSFRIRSGSPAFSVYLKFNVTGLSEAVTRATLRMYVIDDGPYGGAVYSVSNNYAGTSTPWLEDGLNWNNAPALSGTPVAVAGAAKLNAWLEWDVTAALSGDGVFSFGLNSTSTNSVYFSSKEGASAPQLIIETGSGMAVQAPVAQASATPESGVTPLSVNFSSAGSYDPDGSISSYSWNFGDGSSSTQANPAHTYNNAGNYAAVLTVHDNQGAMRTSTVNIAVAAPSALPTAPSNLVATTAGTNAINLSWNDNTSDEDGYHIERKTGASGTYSEIATVDANVTTYGNSGLAQNTAYYYRVRAHNGSGNSAYSNESNATTQSSAGGSGNLALNRPAAASGYYDSAHAPEKAVDGRLDKYWRSQTVSSSSPLAWLQIDLQSAQLVGRAVVSWKDGYFAKSYQVQVSNDASSWTTVYTNSSGAAGAQDFIFPAVTVRYVRLYCTVQNMSSYRVLELELYSGGMAKSGTQEDDQSERMPHTIALQQNYPNPFNPSTKISYSVPEGMHVTLKVYDIIGNAVAILVNGYRAPGVYTVNFNGAHLSAGTYYYVLQAGDTRIVRRLSLVK